MQGNLLPGEGLSKSGLGSRRVAGYLCSDTGLATHHHNITHEPVMSATQLQTPVHRLRGGRAEGPGLRAPGSPVVKPDPQRTCLPASVSASARPRAPGHTQPLTAHTWPGTPAGAEPEPQLRPHLLLFFLKRGFR